MTEAGSENQLKTYGAMITLTRQDIVNDDMGALMVIPRTLGRMAAVKLEKLVYTLLLSNPSAFFSTDNKNLLTGAGSALGIAGLTKADASTMR